MLILVFHSVIVVPLVAVIKAQELLWWSTEFLREDGFVIKLSFDPIHQVLNILWCWNLNWFLDLHPIGPSVLKPEILFGAVRKLLSIKSGVLILGQHISQRQHISYFGPADIVGHVAGVQNSIRVPYRMFTWLKKSTAVKKQQLCDQNMW